MGFIENFVRFLAVQPVWKSVTVICFARKYSEKNIALIIKLAIATAQCSVHSC